MPHDRGGRRERRQRAAGNHVGDGLRTPLIRHLRPFDACTLREQLAREMRQAADHRCVQYLARLGFGQGNEIGHAMHIAVGIDDEYYGDGGEQRNWRKIPRTHLKIV